jgi:hypothetical protein
MHPLLVCLKGADVIGVDQHDNGDRLFREIDYRSLESC